MSTIETEPGKDASFKTRTGETVIEIKNLKKSFDEQEVLINVSLKLFNGEKGIGVKWYPKRELPG